MLKLVEAQKHYAAKPTFKVAVNRKVIDKDPNWESLATDFVNMELTQEELAAEVLEGHAFTTHHKGRRQQENFVAAGYVALDFDKASQEEMMQIMSDPVVKNNYGIFYHTPSSTKEQPKFRVVFQLEKSITDRELYRKTVLAFIWRFSATADKTCKDPCRLFYGSRGKKQKVTGNIIPQGEVDKVVLAYEQDLQHEEILKQQARKISGKLVHNITDKSKNLIFEKMLESHSSRIRSAAEGTRHDTLVKSARALGGYLRGEPGVADENTIRSTLEAAYSSHRGYKKNDMQSAIDYGLKVGQNSPLYLVSLTQPEPSITPQEKPDSKFNAVETFDAESLMGEEFKPIKWTVPGLLPEGATIAAARPKIGKSWMMLELGVAVSSGTKFMDMFQCEKGEVLYCALEDNKRRLQDRLKLLLNGEPPPKGLHFLLNIPKIGEGFIDWMKLWLERHPDTRLIIIDTLVKIKPVKGKEESLYESDYKAGEGIKALTDNYRFSCIMVYHTRKQEAEDPLEKVSGSFGLTGGIDNVWVIDRKTAEANGKMSITGRDIEEQELAVTFDKDKFRWICRGDATMFSEKENREEIFNLFRKNNNTPLKASEISRALDKGPKEYDGVRKLLHRMDGEGLSEDARGYFKLTKHFPLDPAQEKWGF